MFVIFEIDHRYGEYSEYARGVAETSEGAQRAITRLREAKEREDFEWSEASFTEDWREDLVEQGVPEEVAETLTPPADKIAKDRAEEVAKFWEMYDFRAVEVPKLG